MAASVAEAEGLGGLLEYIILLSYHFLCIFTIVIRNNVANGSSWAIWASIWMSLLWQKHWLIRNNLDKSRQMIVVCPPEGSLGPRGGSSGFQRKFVRLLKVFVISGNIGGFMSCPHGSY